MNSITCSVVVGAFGKVMELSEALELLSKTVRDSSASNTITYLAALNASERGGE